MALRPQKWFQICFLQVFKMNSGDAYGYKVRHLPSSAGTNHVLCSILLKTIKDKSLYLAASDGCKSNGAQVTNAPSAAYFRARRKSAGDELVRRARGTSVWAPNIRAPKIVGPSLTSRLGLSCQRISYCANDVSYPRPPKENIDNFKLNLRMDTGTPAGLQRTRGSPNPSSIPAELAA
ncbi:hypothetical protein C8J57DRAFT_1230449 [Mycena rebaudengoi]|nr:hypothetical protein C8J57DRAFT_1230449 [Mycena rebaudengoi]